MSQKARDLEDDRVLSRAVAEASTGKEELSAGSVNAGAAALTVAAVAFYYYDQYNLQSSVQGTGVILAVSALTWFLLFSVYGSAGTAALKRSKKAEAAKYYALFQTNFWYFAFFGLLSYVINVVGADSARTLFGGKQNFGIVQGAVAILTPAALLATSGKTKYY